MMTRSMMAFSAAALTALSVQASAGVSYRTVEELTSPKQNTMKLAVLFSGDNSRSEMSLGDLGGLGGGSSDMAAQAQQGAQAMQAQAMAGQMAQMNQYLDMIKDPKKKEELRQKMAMMQAQMGGAQAQAASQANADVIAQGARQNSAAMSGSSMFALEDLKARTACRYMNMPGRPKEYDQRDFVFAGKSANGWETSSVALTQEKPKETSLNGAKVTLYALKLKYLLAHAASKESSDFTGEIKYWMDASKEKALGAQWRAYNAARRRGGVGGISLRENMDAALYSINTEAGRAQLDKALDAMPGVPLKVEYDLQGKGLKYRLAGVMKAMAAPDTGSDLADATDEASSGAQQEQAAVPADAEAEKPWRMAVTFSELKAAEAPASAFKVPEGYARK